MMNTQKKRWALLTLTILCMAFLLLPRIVKAEGDAPLTVEFWKHRLFSEQEAEQLKIFEPESADFYDAIIFANMQGKFVRYEFGVALGIKEGDATVATLYKPDGTAIQLTRYVEDDGNVYFESSGDDLRPLTMYYSAAELAADYPAGEYHVDVEFVGSGTVPFYATATVPSYTEATFPDICNGSLSEVSGQLILDWQTVSGDIDGYQIESFDLNTDNEGFWEWFELTHPQNKTTFLGIYRLTSSYAIALEAFMWNEGGDILFASSNQFNSFQQCEAGLDCDDGAFCNGDEICPSNGTAIGLCIDGMAVDCAEGQTCDEEANACVTAPACTKNADCGNEVFCDGTETCVAGSCVAGTNPCAEGQTCDEEANTCVTPPECTDDADCGNGVFCDGTETCEAGSCVDGTNPCEAGETCDEVIDECICDLEWDLDGDCDVDKDDAKLLSLRQKAEKTDLSNRHKAEKTAMKAAIGSLVDCGGGWDLDGDCDVDKDDSKLLSLRQKTEKTALSNRHKAEKAAMKAAL